MPFRSPVPGGGGGAATTTSFNASSTARTAPMYQAPPRAPPAPPAPAYAAGGGSPPARVASTYVPGPHAGDDTSFKPNVGGHKSFSWEKELRERGLHASANELALQGDAFFEGVQGQPAPGSGSPKRNRVSPSPQRKLPPGTVPRAGSYSPIPPTSNRAGGGAPSFSPPKPPAYSSPKYQGSPPAGHASSAGYSSGPQPLPPPMSPIRNVHSHASGMTSKSSVTSSSSMHTPRSPLPP
ncbi:hypothetical protein DIPPA_30698 [Diplonema papillatum]|nr:hypothetical protein DIPPA_30698 [Diplonema papillatum]